MKSSECNYRGQPSYELACLWSYIMESNCIYLCFYQHTLCLPISFIVQCVCIVSIGPLEAALQLVYAFSECGPSAGEIVNRGTFPALVNALASADITSHPHPQVLLVYFDIAMRYTRLCLPASIRNIVAGIVGSGGLHHREGRVRSRAAYCFLKITESLEARAHAMLPYLDSITGKSLALFYFVGYATYRTFPCHPLISNVASTVV